MLTEEKAGQLQIKTREGICYQSASVDIIIQWIFESRIGTGDFLFSQKENDWIALFNEPFLKDCFWQLRTQDGKVYGPVSLGELKQLFINRQVNNEIEISPSGSAKQWLAIKDLHALNSWLIEEHSQPIDCRQFLNRLSEQFLPQQQVLMKISRKEQKFSVKIADLKQKIKDQERQIKNHELTHAKLERDLELQRQTAEQAKAKYSEVEPRNQAIVGEVQELKSELQEKALVIDELNKLMAQMEVANTIKDDGIRELRESLESTRQAMPVETDELQRKLNDEEERVNELQLEKEELEQVLEEQKKLRLQKQEELEEDVRKLTDEKEGLQNFIYTLQDDLSKAAKDKEHLEHVSGSAEPLNGTIEELEQAKEALQSELIEKGRLLEEYRAETSNEIDGLAEDNNKLQAEINLLESKLQKVKQNKGIKDAQIQALLNTKNRLIEAIGGKEESINQFEDKIISKDGLYRLEQERFNQQLKDMAEELGHREELVKSLEYELDELKINSQSQFKDLEDRLAGQAEEFKAEQAHKQTELEGYILEKERLESEMTSWKEGHQQIEGELVQVKAELEGQILEKERLQKELYDLNEEWKTRMSVVEEETQKQYEQLAEEKESLQSNLTGRLNSLETEQERLERDLDEANKRNDQILQDKDILQQELAQREKFIDEIKREAERQREELIGKEEELAGINNKIGELQGKITELTSQLQNEVNIQNNLRNEISIMNEESAKDRQMLEQINTEKEGLKQDMARQNEDFAKKENQLEQEMDEIKRNCEHITEESRNLQRQFYLEKQKLTKEYTETINKQAKIEKKNQLEREVADRARMKDELERLYNLLKDNFEGLQKGSLELQTSFQQIQSEIDNKRLSLKYMSESEKRNGKKPQFSRTDTADKENNTPEGE